MDLFDPNWWVSAGILGAVVTAVSIIIQVILNKKLRTPADEETREENARSWEKDAIAERNDILARYKAQVTDAEGRADRLQVRLTEAEKLIGEVERRIRDVEAAQNVSDAAWLHWGYKALAVIRRLGGTDSDIPTPTPGAMNLGRISVRPDQPNNGA